MGPVLAPVELECLARLEHQRHECPAIGRLLRALPVPFQARTKAETRSYEPSKPSCTRSACICLAVRRSLRDLRCSVISQPDSFSAYGSSLLGRADVWNWGSTTPARRYFLMVLRDSPVRRAISRMDILSRIAQRRMTLKNPMSITPIAPDKSRQGQGSTWVSSQ